ncbi:unnamed protein product [Gordionus sp. m RMFG-2023]
MEPYLKSHLNIYSDQFKINFQNWQKLSNNNLCMNRGKSNRSRCRQNISGTGQQINYYDNTELEEIRKRPYEFLDENSNTSLYKRFPLLDIPKAFFIHNASELCSGMGWSYDFSSYGKSSQTYFSNTDTNTRSTNSFITSLFQNYIKIINDGMNMSENREYFKDKYDINDQYYKPIKQMSLIIGILSKPDDFEVRQKLRKIWASSISAYLKLSYSNRATYIGSYLTFNNSRNETVVCKVKAVFILGIFEPKMDISEEILAKMSKTKLDRWNNNCNKQRKEVQLAIDIESIVHGDIIQATFVESYKNLSYKTGALFKWVSTYCDNAQFLLKLDVDNYANLDVLMSVLENITSPSIEIAANFTEDKILSSEHQPSSKNTLNSKSRVIPKDNNDHNNLGKDTNRLTPLVDDLMEFQRSFYCNVWDAMEVVREVDHPNFIDVKDFKEDMYPRYCSGMGYVLSPKLAGIIYQKSLECCLVPFPNEDAFWTGIIPNKTLSLNYTDLYSYYIYKESDWHGESYIFRYYGEDFSLLRKHYFLNTYF